MDVTARQADENDLPSLIRLYRELASEMAPLSDMWWVADGLPEPIEDSLADAFDDERTRVYVGEIEGVVFGFCLVTIDDVHPQGEGVRIGSFRLIFVDHDAREVGVGEAMRDRAMSDLSSLGITRFDAHVLPGHRLVKNFFEAGGFSARSIVMHHDAER